MRVSLEKVLRAIEAGSSLTLTIVKRCTQGEQRATYLAQDQEGRRFILKWHPDPQMADRWHLAQMVLDRLRANGYPAPRYILVGTTPQESYLLQSMLPGTTIDRLTTSMLPQLRTLLEQHLGQAPPGERSWPKEVVRTVLVGGNGYCLHDSLLTHGSHTRSLLAELQRIVQAHHAAIHVTEDIVHFDFQPANFLVENGAISGVVDWDAVQAGDGAFDWATLLYYCYGDPELRELIWSYALTRSSVSVLSVYLAHLILRQVDWSLRHHASSLAQQYIDRSGSVLRDIAARLP